MAARTWIPRPSAAVHQAVRTTTRRERKGVHDGASLVWSQADRGGSGQPGVVRTLSAVPSVEGSWVITAAGSYGWRPNVLVSEGDGDAVHNNWGRLAVSYAPWSFFQVALSLDQHVDLYSGSAEQSGLVSGAVGDPWITFRTGFDLGGGISFGGHFGLLFPSGLGSFSASGKAISPVIDLTASFERLKDRETV